MKKKVAKRAPGGLRKAIGIAVSETGKPGASAETSSAASKPCAENGGRDSSELPVQKPPPPPLKTKLTTFVVLHSFSSATPSIASR